MKFKKENGRFLFITCCLFNFFYSEAIKIESDDLIKKRETQSIVFTENKGQIHDQNYQPRPDVLYSAIVGNLGIHITNSGVSYQLYDYKNNGFDTDITNPLVIKDKGKLTLYRVDLNWLNANKKFNVTQDGVLPGYCNYYTEGCKDGALFVKSYRGITLQNLYNGINLHYYEQNGQLKHDYIVAPYTDYKQIIIEIKGATVAANKDGSLILTTPLGKIQEGAPLVFQGGKQLKAAWVIKNQDDKTYLSFEIEKHNNKEELIIDPITRSWATYYGGNSWDYSHSVCTSSSGDVYLAGATASGGGNNIATVGSHQSTIATPHDAYLAKFNPGGVRLWGTYYGGPEWEVALSNDVDINGNVYIVGYVDLISSSSGTAIATTGAHQTTGSGGVDAFVAKFDSNGFRLWGTYYGGSGNEYGHSCITDPMGNLYLVGETTTSNGTIIATSGSHQQLIGGGTDGFLVKFNTNGVRQWGTYYGGTGTDKLMASAYIGSGHIYIAGATDSNGASVISTQGSHQSINNGSSDAFLVKFNDNGIRQWGTYYGDLGSESGTSIKTDNFGNVYLAGITNSNSSLNIATVGAHQLVNSGGQDAFLVKFNSNGQRSWGTYFGGQGNESDVSCAVNSSAEIILTGITSSTSGIVTNAAYQSINNGATDVFVSKFNGNNGTLAWGTYYGGEGPETNKTSVVCDNDGAIYVCAATKSTQFISSPGAFQSTFGGNPVEDGFLVKLLDQPNTTYINTLAPINSDILLFPNPSNGKFKIKSKSDFCVGLVNHLGHIVKTLQIKQGENHFCFEDLTDGLYFIRTQDGLYNSRVVIKK